MRNRPLVAGGPVLAWTLLAGLLPAQTPPAGAEPSPREQLEPFEIVRNLPFVQRGGKDLKLDVYRPKSEGRRPLVLVIHGGGWRMGSRGLSEAVPFAKSLASRGFVAASIDYRKAPKFAHPAQIEDCRVALQWLRATADRHGIDPTRVGSLGASAGGHLAALLATQPDAADPAAEDAVARQSTRVACCVAYLAPFDLVPRDGDPEPSATQVRVLSDFLGAGDLKDPASLGRALETAKSASPAAHVDAADPPFFIAMGGADTLVPPVQGRRMVEVLGAAGVPAEFLEIPGGGHGEWMGQIWEPDPVTAEDYWKRSVAFLRRHLSPVQARSTAGGG